jgi:hypothetical protein
MNTNPSGRRVAIVTASATRVDAATALAVRRGYELLIYGRPCAIDNLPAGVAADESLFDLARLA